MINHVSLGVSDLGRAVAFYDVVLKPMGYVRLWTKTTSAGYGSQGTDEPFALHAVAAHARPPGAGCHLAFTAPTRQAVDEFHAIAIEMGGTNEGAPGIRAHYGENYYAAFVLDLDGYKLEAVCHEN